MKLRSNNRGDQLNIKPRGFENKRKRSNGKLILLPAAFLAICACVLSILSVLNSRTASETLHSEPAPSLRKDEEEKQELDPIAKDGKTELVEKLPEKEKKYHLVFSTSCSDFQRWQSYTLFFHAKKISQPGRVIRIASGCDEATWQEEIEWHRDHISNTMSSDFDLHLTPNFSSVKDQGGKNLGNYKYFNKPFGLLHWMKNDPHLGFDPETKKLKDEDAIIILIDPDMVMTRPITGDFSDVEIDLLAGGEGKRKVEHGSPIAQKYGLGAQWRRFDLENIAGEDSPARSVSEKDGFTFYPAGPRK